MLRWLLSCLLLVVMMAVMLLMIEGLCVVLHVRWSLEAVVLHVMAVVLSIEVVMAVVSGMHFVVSAVIVTVHWRVRWLVLVIGAKTDGIGCIDCCGY